MQKVHINCTGPLSLAMVMRTRVSLTITKVYLLQKCSVLCWLKFKCVVTSLQKRQTLHSFSGSRWPLADWLGKCHQSEICHGLCHLQQEAYTEQVSNKLVTIEDIYFGRLQVSGRWGETRAVGWLGPGLFRCNHCQIIAIIAKRFGLAQTIPSLPSLSPLPKSLPNHCPHCHHCCLPCQIIAMIENCCCRITSCQIC